tara:strand:- start:2037 stop:2756 length:720 start_codon:yes stop_codon:yes gene_type:complete
MYRVLIVDDDPEIARGLEAHLAEEGLETLRVEEGDSVIPTLKEEERAGRPIDLILLDIGLEGRENGFELYPKIRELLPSTLVFFLTGRRDNADQVHGLRLADDYITKPYEGKVVAVKVKEAISRRRTHPDDICVASGPFVYDKARQEVRYYDKVLELAPLERNLLTCLLSRPGKIFSRRALLGKVWRDRFVSDRSVDVQIKRIREELKRNQEVPNPHDVIKTHTDATPNEAGYSLNDKI